MNDRFKFRVYHLITGKYVDNGETEILLQNTGQLLFGNWHNDIRFAQSEYGIEQCTGLKDKNGNLIYEGDVVQYSYGRKGVVSFGKYTGCFAAGWENINIDLMGWYLDDYYEPDNCGRLRINLDNTHDSITEEDANDFEIIGNIHEQAEQKD